MKRDCRKDFLASWGGWIAAITEYAIATRNPAAGLKRAMKDVPVNQEETVGDPHGIKLCILVAYINNALFMFRMGYTDST